MKEVCTATEGGDKAGGWVVVLSWNGNVSRSLEEPGGEDLLGSAGQPLHA